MPPVTRVACAVAVVAGAFGSRVALAQSIVPVPNVTLDRTHMELKGKVGETLTQTFAVNNRAACGVVMSKQRASLHGITVDCPRWEMGGYESTTCEVRATRSSGGKLVDRFLFTAHVADDCKTTPLATVDARQRGELQALIDEEARLRKLAPDEAQLQEREKQVEGRYDDKAFDRQKKALEAEAEADKAILASAWAEAERMHAERVERQRLKLEIIQSDKSAIDALDARIEKMRQEEAADIKALTAEADKADKAARDVLEQKNVQMGELRRGQWHDKCSRTASEIEAAEGVSLAAHLRSAGGRMIPVPQSVIDKRAADMNKKFEEALNHAATLRAKLGPAREKWAEKIQAIEAKRPDIERAKAASIEKARSDMSLLDDQQRKALMSHRARLEAVDRKLEERVEEARSKHDHRKKDLAAEIKALRAAHEKAVDDHRARIFELMNKISGLRNELVSLANAIRNAHVTGYNLGVRIDAVFHD